MGGPTSRSDAAPATRAQRDRFTLLVQIGPELGLNLAATFDAGQTLEVQGFGAFEHRLVTAAFQCLLAGSLGCSDVFFPITEADASLDEGDDDGTGSKILQRGVAGMAEIKRVVKCPFGLVVGFGQDPDAFCPGETFEKLRVTLDLRDADDVVCFVGHGACSGEGIIALNGTPNVGTSEKLSAGVVRNCGQHGRKENVSGGKHVVEQEREA